MFTTFMQVLMNLLYFYGMCGLLKECLLQRYFSKVFFHSLSNIMQVESFLEVTLLLYIFFRSLDAVFREQNQM